MEKWRQDVIDEARTWLRTPWHHNQSAKGAGVDCAQLIKACYVNTQLVLPFQTGYYPVDWMLHREDDRFLSWLGKYADQVNDPQPGDAAVWRYGRAFSHGAIVTGWPKIIHAYRPERMVVEGDASRGPLAERPVVFYQLRRMSA